MRREQLARVTWLGTKAAGLGGPLLGLQVSPAQGTVRIAPAPDPVSHGEKQQVSPLGWPFHVTDGKTEVNSCSLTF